MEKGGNHDPCPVLPPLGPSPSLEMRRFRTSRETHFVKSPVVVVPHRRFTTDTASNQGNHDVHGNHGNQGNQAVEYGDVSLSEVAISRQNTDLSVCSLGLPSSSLGLKSPSGEGLIPVEDPRSKRCYRSAATSPNLWNQRPVSRLPPSRLINAKQETVLNVNASVSLPNGISNFGKFLVSLLF